MPSFEISLPDLKTSGPILPIFVGPSLEMIAALSGEANVGPVPVSALIDTGAASTVITRQTAALLGLKSVGTVSVHTPTTIEPVWCRQFHVNVYLSPTVAIENVLTVEGALTGQPFQCLIGRDILSRGRWVYDGIHNRFSLEFP